MSANSSPSMAGLKSIAAESGHVAGDWYSVPDLRLRDHHFTVPLDYHRPDSPNISLLARELVSGVCIFFLSLMLCTVS